MAMTSDDPNAGANIAASRLFALVACAGVGNRAAGALPKQYALLAGRCVVGHALHAMGQVQRLCASLVVLSPQDDLFEQHCPEFKGWVARCGGPTRAASVGNGLQELVRRGARDHDWVLVHDAARCLLRPQWVNRLIDACLIDGVGGLLAMPLADTLKQEIDGRVVATVDRSNKWSAQTPQMFRLGLLRDALARAGAAVTDEASAVEAAGFAPLLVRGSVQNIKVTWPEDMELAGHLLGGSWHASDPNSSNLPKADS
jgi:2-C-methyl-D-erythritol 4-phosphate cytidylyltransferase